MYVINLVPTTDAHDIVLQYSDGTVVVQWLCDLQKLNVTELSVFVLQFLPNVAILFAHPTTDEVLCIVCATCVHVSVCLCV